MDFQSTVQTRSECFKVEEMGKSFFSCSDGFIFIVECWQRYGGVINEMPMRYDRDFAFSLEY